jgi:hypothetical protein
VAGGSEDAEDRRQDEKPEVQAGAARGAAAKVLDLALLRVVADAGLRSATWQAGERLLAGQRAVLRVRDFLRLHRHCARVFLARGCIHHEENHVGEVHRLNDVLEVVTACYIHIRVVVNRV